MARNPQDFRNHARWVPGFHFFAVPLLLAALVFFTVRAVRAPSADTVWTALFALAVLALAGLSRLAALGVQDRVIRLEERLRLREVLPDDLRSRIPELTTDHLIGLRFASDGELEELVRRVLAGELRDRKDIKKAVRNWRADHQRV